MPRLRSTLFTAIALIGSIFSLETPAFSAPYNPQQSAEQATSAEQQSEAAAVSTVEDAHSNWLAGAQAAALIHGCTNVAVEQQYGESVSDAIAVFGQKALEGSCLLLQPVSTSLSSGRYSFAWGGQINGIDIVYISDVGRPRIWNGVEVPLQ